MASSSNVQSFLVLVMATIFLTIPSNAQLTPDFYDKICPQALPTIKYVVQRAIYREPRMGASLLRLHFHDCFVNGCDGSLLLDDTPTFIGEKTAPPNNGSIRGLDVVDEIKAAVDNACNGPVVSCADILAVAARDSVSILGGPFYWYNVLLGRRDARTASKDAVTSPEGLVSPFLSFSQLLSNFQTHGLDLKDLVALSGAHTIGLARCTTFRSRIYNDANIDPHFASYLQATCPSSGGDDNLTKLDATPARFDNAYYYEALMGKRGVLHSDQELFKGDGGESDTLVQLYSQNPNAFATDFAASMIKMGNMKPLTGNQGEVRLNCRKVN